MSQTIAFVDLETTGTDPGRHHTWEIGIVLRADGRDVEYAWQLRPDLTTADSVALRIGRYYERSKLLTRQPYEAFRLAHPSLVGRDPDDLDRLTMVPAVAAAVAMMLDGAVMVAANVAFDASFLAAFLRANGEAPAWDHHLIEVESYAAGALGWQPPWKLDKFLTEFGIAVPEEARHTALGDALAVRNLFDRAAGQRTIEAVARS